MEKRAIPSPAPKAWTVCRVATVRKETREKEVSLDFEVSLETQWKAYPVPLDYQGTLEKRVLTADLESPAPRADRAPRETSEGAALTADLEALEKRETAGETAETGNPASWGQLESAAPLETLDQTASPASPALLENRVLTAFLEYPGPRAQLDATPSCL